MGYRIKAKQVFTIGKIMMGRLSESHKKSKYYVQYKYKFLPFFITITSSFDTKEQAEEHIKLKLEVS